VFVEVANTGIVKENAAATVWLQTVLVWIDDDGIDFGDSREGCLGFSSQILRQGEVTAERGVRVVREFPGAGRRNRWLSCP